MRGSTLRIVASSCPLSRLTRLGQHATFILLGVVVQLLFAVRNHPTVRVVTGPARCVSNAPGFVSVAARLSRQSTARNCVACVASIDPCPDCHCERRWVTSASPSAPCDPCTDAQGTHRDGGPRRRSQVRRV